MTKLSRMIEEGRAKKPLEKQQEMSTYILKKKEEFKSYDLQKVFDEANNENKVKDLHFVTYEEWAENIQLKQRAFYNRLYARGFQDGVAGARHRPEFVRRD